MNAARFLTIDDLANMPKPKWLINGLFEVNSLVMLAAPSYSFKSFMALDWLCCMASGREWNQRSVVPSKALYVLGEGKSSLLKRIQAWTNHHKCTKSELQILRDNFRVSFDVPQMAIKDSVDKMLRELAETGYKPDVMVIDTFARSFVGMDENDAKDTGLWVEQAERLRNLGFTVIFLHHTAKNTEFGVKYRGSTAIMGAMDTAMTMIRDFKTNKVKLEVTKQKDHDEGEPMEFQRRVVNNSDEEGSMVLVPTDATSARFTMEHLKVEDAVGMLLQQPYESDRARARELARKFNITEMAAQSKISRFRKENEVPQDMVEPLDITPHIVEG